MYIFIYWCSARRRHGDGSVENDVDGEKSSDDGVADLELLIGEEAGLLLLSSLSLEDGDDLGELESTRQKTPQSRPMTSSGKLKW
ncbi:hypothetical protein COP2_025441 [Malus domestica]